MVYERLPETSYSISSRVYCILYMKLGGGKSKQTITETTVGEIRSDRSDPVKSSRV